MRSQIEDAARAILAMDVTRCIVQHANNLDALGTSLTKKIKELMGCTCVFLLYFFDDDQSHYQIIGIAPARKKDIMELPSFKSFVECLDLKTDEDFMICYFGDDTDVVHKQMTYAGIHNIATLILKTDERVAGVLGAVNLEDASFGQDIFQSFSELNLLLAAIMEISNQYEILEERIKVRTMELEEARNEAVKANEAKSRFLSNMSHELRTPLNGIIGMNQLVLDTDLTLEQKEYIELSQSSAKALLGTIGDILDYSKIEAGRMTLDEDVFVFETIMREVIDLFKVISMKKGLQFMVEGDLESRTLLIGDAYKVRQILVNLLGNAFKFTEQGQVYFKFSAQKVESSVFTEFIVKDTGCGMSEGEKSRVFERFTQLDDRKTKHYEGTGLGLAITKELVKLLGGNIDLTTAQNLGTEFVIQLPMKPAS